MTYKIINEDINIWSKEYTGEKFHALFCDAPYHLTTTVKRFSKTSLDDNTQTSERIRGRVDGFARLAGSGFMGQSWDGGDVAFRPETWEGMKQHLYPGAFGMTFGGSRTAHRMAVAIEDAGFIIHPMISWVYGSGFPKATRLKGRKEFSGHRYGLGALKPAMEPIIVFQKPYEGRPIDNMVETGAGVLNIDGGRIPLNGDSYNINRFDDGMKPFGNGAGHSYTPITIKTGSGKGKKGDVLGWAKTERNGEDWEGSELGRWPSNFIIDDTVSDSLAESSKFFFNVQTNFDDADPFVYEKKVSQKERNAGMGEDKNNHPTLKSISLTKYLSTILLPPIDYAPRRLLIPFSGVSSEMIGALLSGWEYVEGVELTPEYIPIAHKRLEHWIK